MTILPCRLLAALALLAGLAAAPGSAIAGQSYDNCTGFIDSIPAVVTKQGTWCLRGNLGTAMTSGKAITIAANNVTIDCNDFKIGGLAAGDASVAIGIYANDRQNATVRHCHVRGFSYGILIFGGAGHLIEDNRLDKNLVFGINLQSSTNNLVQRNRVHDTGGAPESRISIGIHGDADMIGNTVDGVFVTGTGSTSPFGIVATGVGNAILNNRVRGLVIAGNGYGYGIAVRGAGGMVDGNHVAMGTNSGVGVGLDGAFAGPAYPACSYNVIVGFNHPMSGCVDAGGNISF